MTLDDPELVERVVAHLLALIDQRRAVLADGRDPTDATAMARVLFVVDGMEAVQNRFTDRDGGRLLDDLARVLRDGPAAGVLTVFSTDRTGFTSRLASAVGTRLVLPMADLDDDLMVGVDRHARPGHRPPGRAVLLPGSVEVQVAEPPAGTTFGPHPDDTAVPAELLPTASGPFPPRWTWRRWPAPCTSIPASTTEPSMPGP